MDKKPLSLPLQTFYIFSHEAEFSQTDLTKSLILGIVDYIVTYKIPKVFNDKILKNSPYCQDLITLYTLYWNPQTLDKSQLHSISSQLSQKIDSEFLSSSPNLKIFTQKIFIRVALLFGVVFSVLSENNLNIYGNKTLQSFTLYLRSSGLKYYLLFPITYNDSIDLSFELKSESKKILHCGDSFTTFIVPNGQKNFYKSQLQNCPICKNELFEKERQQLYKNLKIYDNCYECDNKSKRKCQECKLDFCGSHKNGNCWECSGNKSSAMGNLNRISPNDIYLISSNNNGILDYEGKKVNNNYKFDSKSTKSPDAIIRTSFNSKNSDLDLLNQPISHKTSKVAPILIIPAPSASNSLNPATSANNLLNSKDFIIFDENLKTTLSTLTLKFWESNNLLIKKKNQNVSSLVIKMNKKIDFIINKKSMVNLIILSKIQNLINIQLFYQLFILNSRLKIFSESSQFIFGKSLNNDVFLCISLSQPKKMMIYIKESKDHPIENNQEIKNLEKNFAEKCEELNSSYFIYLCCGCKLNYLQNFDLNFPDLKEKINQPCRMHKKSMNTSEKKMILKFYTKFNQFCCKCGKKFDLVQCEHCSAKFCKLECSTDAKNEFKIQGNKVICIVCQKLTPHPLASDKVPIKILELSENPAKFIQYHQIHYSNNKGSICTLCGEIKIPDHSLSKCQSCNVFLISQEKFCKVCTKTKNNKK